MRTVPFPMKDPYSPAVNARIPVSGLTRFPWRYNVMEPAYYGIESPVIVNAEAAAVVNGATTTEPSGFAGFADSGFGFVAPIQGVNLPGTSTGDGTDNDGGGGGIDWGAIINAGIHSAPAIIQAAEGGGAPYNFYQQGVSLPQSQQGQVYRDAYGNIINPQSAYQTAGGLGAGAAQIGNSLSSFVAQNPLLVLGGLAAVVLLMTRPPGRR